jgi:hypothetical protein
LDLDWAWRYYLESYRLHFLNPLTNRLWVRLCKEAKGVWTESLDDASCDNYDPYSQCALANQYEIKAIMMIAEEFDLKFTGSKMVRIRADSEDPIGVDLSSPQIPFALPQFLPSVPARPSWEQAFPTSLEFWWNAAKGLYVENDSINLIMSNPHDQHFFRVFREGETRWTREYY